MENISEDRLLKNFWVGWIIEQSLDSLDIFDEYQTIRMKSEDEDWREHIVEIPEEKLDNCIDWLKNNIKVGWYSHIIKGNEGWIIFRDRAFNISAGTDYSEVENYGVKQSISKEQMDIENLFVQYCEEGFE